MTAATLGASAAVPASAWISDASTTACCGVSPIGAVRWRGSPRRHAGRTRRRWSGGSGRRSGAFDEVGVGPGEALDRRLVALVASSGSGPTARGARNAARSCPGSAPTRSAIWSRRRPGGSASDGVVAAARGRGRRPARRARPTRPTRPCSGGAGRCRPGTSRRPTPSYHTWNASEEPITPRDCSSSPASFVPHPGLISTATPAPSPPGGWSCQTNQPPATRNGRTRTARTPTTAQVRRRRRARSARTRPVAAAPAYHQWSLRAVGPIRWPIRQPDRRIGRRIGGSGEPLAESVGESADPVNPRAESVGESVPRNSGVDRLAERPSHDSSWPPSSVGVTRAARTAGVEPRLQDHRRRRGVDVVALGAPATVAPGSRHLGGCAGRSSW